MMYIVRDDHHFIHMSEEALISLNTVHSMVTRILFLRELERFSMPRLSFCGFSRLEIHIDTKQAHNKTDPTDQITKRRFFLSLVQTTR